MKRSLGAAAGGGSKRPTSGSLPPALDAADDAIGVESSGSAPGSESPALGKADASLVDAIRKAGVDLVIFDLDMTLWDGNCNTFAGARALVSATEVVHRASGRSLRLYADVPAVFSALRAARVRICIASASPTEAVALSLLRSFGLHQHIEHAVIKPGSKAAHLRACTVGLGVQPRRTIFFDDLNFNLREAEALGITGALVRAGISIDVLRQTLRKHRARAQGASLMRAWCTAAPAASAPGAPAAAPAAPGPARPAEGGAAGSAGTT